MAYASQNSDPLQQIMAFIATHGPYGGVIWEDLYREMKKPRDQVRELVMQLVAQGVLLYTEADKSDSNIGRIPKVLKLAHKPSRADQDEAEMLRAFAAQVAEEDATLIVEKEEVGMQTESPNAKTYGEMVAKARKAKGWSQHALGEQVGYTTSMISIIEGGKRAPKKKKFDLLNQVLGLCFSYDEMLTLFSESDIHLSSMEGERQHSEISDLIQEREEELTLIARDIARLLERRSVLQEELYELEILRQEEESLHNQLKRFRGKRS